VDCVKSQMLRTFTNLTDPHLREMLIGSIIGLGIKVLAAISIFVMNIAVAQTLGAAEAGLFFLGFTLVTMAAAVGRLGLDQSIVRFIAAQQATDAIGTLHGVYRKSIIWVALASSGLALLGWISIDWLVKNLFDQPGFEPVLRSFILAIPLVALYTMQAQALQGLKKIAKSMLTLNVIVPVTLLLMMLLAPVISAVALAHYFNIACLFTLAVGLIFWFQSAPRKKASESFPSSLLRKTCVPLWAVAVLSQVVQWSSQLMLGAWSTSEEVAFFATAQRTAMLTSFVLFAVNAIAAPKFAAMYAKGDHDGLKRLAIISVRLMLLAAVPVLALMLFFPEWLMSFFGEEFRAASTALVILALGQFVNIATGSVGYLLSMTGLERKVRDNAFFSALIGVALGLVLIPSYGLLGASIATAVAIASQNLLGVYQVQKHLGFNTLIFWQ
jgi:O-antigen/teichoic acid export membrane protein